MNTGTLSRRPILPVRWKLQAAELLADTPTSRVWKVLREDGRPAVLKALKPLGVEDELRGKYLLRWRQGFGLIRLLRAAGPNLLLEYAGERPLSAVIASDGDSAATEIAADVLARLMAPSTRPLPAELQPLRERFQPLFDKAQIDRDAGRNSHYPAAAAIAQRLLDSPVAHCPLHGDLHHDNIYYGRRGWLAIDPKGLVGDPGFDAANLFFNPLERTDLCLDHARIAFMAVTFGATLKQSPRLMLDHAIAYGALSAAWHAGDANAIDEARELSVVAAVSEVAAHF
ncbi:streptomycin 6-kinase [Tahibacter aquaticus]|uniref:Streptomycin 6-kinase n=1 Tax=Tahibacter aquaticus TaxID=520092 RepID=A0A4R6YQV3_9GAMM|nr:streptomycin 6-kinase [Tahibacter aquaticus]